MKTTKNKAVQNSLNTFTLLPHHHNIQINQKFNMELQQNMRTQSTFKSKCTVNNKYTKHKNFRSKLLPNVEKWCVVLLSESELRWGGRRSRKNTNLRIVKGTLLEYCSSVGGCLVVVVLSTCVLDQRVGAESSVEWRLDGFLKVCFWWGRILVGKYGTIRGC